MTLITRQIPTSDSYPGLIAHDMGEGREIVVMATGPEAEEVLRLAVEERRK